MAWAFWRVWVNFSHGQLSSSRVQVRGVCHPAVVWRGTGKEQGDQVAHTHRQSRRQEYQSKKRQEHEEGRETKRKSAGGHGGFSFTLFLRETKRARRRPRCLSCRCRRQERSPRRGHCRGLGVLQAGRPGSSAPRAGCLVILGRLHTRSRQRAKTTGKPRLLHLLLLPWLFLLLVLRLEVCF